MSNFPHEYFLGNEHVRTMRRPTKVARKEAGRRHRFGPDTWRTTTTTSMKREGKCAERTPTFMGSLRLLSPEAQRLWAMAQSTRKTNQTHRLTRKTVLKKGKLMSKNEVGISKSVSPWLSCNLIDVLPASRQVLVPSCVVLFAFFISFLSRVEFAMSRSSLSLLLPV